MTATTPSVRPQQAIPFWRDVRIIAILLQVAFVIVMGLFFFYLYRNMMAGLTRLGLLPDLSFFRTEAGIAISEGLPYQPSDVWQRAFLVGVVNTLRIAVVGVVLATLLGVVVGVSRLSSNWLLRTLSYGFVELIRNIPVLVQLIFWSFVLASLPRVQESLAVGNVMFLNARGVYLAWPRGSETVAQWYGWLGAALLVGVAVFVWRRWDLQRRDRPGTVLPWALLAALVVAAVGFAVVALTSGAAPLRVDAPVLDRFNFRGGTVLTSQYATLLIGLVLYTSAFIGEIVRAGIQAVSHGQREAARALGLSETQTLRLVVFPQALRVIIPPLTNQYLNLTKNSSLAIAVGYQDLFNIAFTAANQTGQVVPIVVIVMLSYLSVSLLTSLIMNWYNQRIQLVER